MIIVLAIRDTGNASRPAPGRGAAAIDGPGAGQPELACAAGVEETANKKQVATMMPRAGRHG